MIRKINSLLLLLFTLITGCEMTEYKEVSYEELQSIIKNNPSSKLCSWYHDDNLSKKDDDSFLYVDYICIVKPGGSEIERKICLKVDKNLVDIDKTGPVSIKDIKLR